jgi:hypothetical protein
MSTLHQLTTLVTSFHAFVLGHVIWFVYNVWHALWNLAMPYEILQVFQSNHG